MRPVEVVERDICEGICDLTIVPCSGKMKMIERPRNQARIDFFGLPSPFELRDKFAFGQVSPLFKPSKNIGQIQNFAFAASVHNRSNPDAIESIGRQLGQITKNSDQIRLVEAPFLGCGDGGLMPSVAMFALAKGFLETRHPHAALQLCTDSAVSAQLAKSALDSLYRLLQETNSVTNNSSSNTNYDYDIALSFAGEQRAFIQVLAYMLKAHGVKVFYDNDEQAELWGKNLVDHLYSVYAKRSRYCVILVSKDYVQKEWTNHERQAAQERAFREKGNEYILPIYFDDSALQSLPETIGYLDAEIGVEKIFELLMKKLAI